MLKRSIFILLPIVLSNSLAASDPSFIEVSQASKIEITNQTQHTCQITHENYEYNTSGLRQTVEGVVLLPFLSLLGAKTALVAGFVIPAIGDPIFYDCEIGQSISPNQTVEYDYHLCFDRTQFHCDDDSESLSFEFLPDGGWTEIVGLHLKQNPKSEVTIVLQDNNHAVIQKK